MAFPAVHSVAVSLAGFLCIGWLAGCGPEVDAAGWELEEERVQLSQRLALLNYRLEVSKPAAVSETVEAVNGRASKAIVQVGLLHAKRLHLQQQVSRAGEEIAEMKEADLQQRRNDASGQWMAEYRDGSGQIYLDATVVSVEDSGVSLQHRHGAVRLRFEDLTPEQREQYGIDAKAAQVAIEVEHELSIAYALWLDETIERIEEEKREIASVAAEDRRNILAKNTAALPIQTLASTRAEVPSRRLQAPTRALRNTTRYSRERRARTYYQNFVYVVPAPAVCPPAPAPRLVKTPHPRHSIAPTPAPTPRPARP